MSERELRIYWALCPGLEPSTYRKLFYHFGSVLAVQNASEAQWLQAVRLHPGTLRQMQLWRGKAIDKAEASEGRITAKGIRCFVQGDALYPPSLLHLHDPPVVLFALGAGEPWMQSAMVSVVGTRRASSYGLEATRWVSASLARTGTIVCSGMALGIDACAHTAALDAGVSSVAVLGCGVGICYPPSNRSLYTRLQNEGVLLSEYSPYSLAAKHRFPERNRIIAALSSATVVIQAGEKSGALRTAESALEVGRDVYVVPGPITSKSFRGSHQLLMDGAIPLLDPETFAQQFSPAEEVGSNRETRPHIPSHLVALANLLLEEGPLRAGEIAQLSAEPPGHIYAMLLELELALLVHRLPDGRYEMKV